MDIIYLLIPISLVLVVVIVAVLFWADSRRFYEEVESIAKQPLK